MKTLSDETFSLRDHIQASGRPYVPLTDEEYERLKREKFRESAMLEAQKVKIDYERIGIHESEASLTWSAVKPGVSDGWKGLEAVKPAYERGWGVVFLWGSWGQAKTLLGKILTATALRDGKRTAYANMSGVLNNIRLAFDERENKTTELLRRMDWWLERDVLFLDELDKANSTPWAQEQIFILLDRRYQMAVREEALTVIASNSSTDALDGYLKSRLHDRRVGQVVYLNGKDGRTVVPDEWRY